VSSKSEYKQTTTIQTLSYVAQYIVIFLLKAAARKRLLHTALLIEMQNSQVS